MNVIVVEPGTPCQTKSGTPMVVRDGLAVVGEREAYMTQRDYDTLRNCLAEDD